MQLHMADPDLTAGNEIETECKKFKACCRLKYSVLFSEANVQHCFSKFNTFLTLVSGKHYWKVALSSLKFWKAQRFHINPYYIYIYCDIVFYLLIGHEIVSHIYRFKI